MLQSLERHIGLPIALEPTRGELHWPEAVSVGEISARRRGELAEFIAGKDDGAADEVVYTVYRHIARREDGERLAAARLRYDLTVIRPGAFSGGEFFRTAGHYHALLPGGIAYPEVYEVISGRAYWLIQRPAPPARPAEAPAKQTGGPEAGNPSVLEAIYLIEAGPGEKALIPPGFGHISINTGTDPLVMANWISEDCTYDYEPFRRSRGGGYWIREGEVPGTMEFERNPGYAAVPELKKLRPKEIPELGLMRSRPLYSLAHEPGRLQFLNDPESFLGLLSIDTCYRRVV